MPLPESLQGDEWSPNTARKILPLLVSYAEACRSVTYGQLTQEVIRRKWGHYVIPLAYRYPAGAIGYALEETEIEWGELIPPINALIVNDSTGLPGKDVDYFLKKYLSHTKRPKSLTKDQRQSVIEEIHKDIFNYTSWRRLLGHYGLDDPPPFVEKAKDSKAKRKQYNWSGEAESEDHRRLKAYVSQHPELIELPKTAAPGLTEYLLPSADKIDILFVDKGWRVGVEVKAINANEDDLRRGIFQCVKYRELLRAEQRTEGVIPQSRAILVIERDLPKSLSWEAKLLHIPFVKIDLTAKLNI
jgi:hypothetical protein